MRNIRKPPVSLGAGFPCVPVRIIAYNQRRNNLSAVIPQAEIRPLRAHFLIALRLAARREVLERLPSAVAWPH
jgi:hypothetical protein